jgi:hypothetical protein
LGWVSVVEAIENIISDQKAGNCRTWKKARCERKADLAALGIELMSSMTIINYSFESFHFQLEMFVE